MLLPQIAAGLVAANVVEWLAHKYVLHGLGKKRGSFWSFHWAGHHRTSRKNDMYDPSYHESVFGPSRWKENLGIVGLLATQSPFLVVAPWYVLTTWAYGIWYLWAHRKTHVDVEWGKKWMPWHVDHHLGKDQDANWGVVAPWFDWVARSRVKFTPGLGVWSKMWAKLTGR